MRGGVRAGGERGREGAGGVRAGGERGREGAGGQAAGRLRVLDLLTERLHPLGTGDAGREGT